MSAWNLSSILGYLLRVPIKRIQQCILETLHKSIQPSNKSPISANDYDGLKPAPLDYLLRIQCTSDLCETLVKVNDDDLVWSCRKFGTFVDLVDRGKWSVTSNSDLEIITNLLFQITSVDLHSSEAFIFLCLAECVARMLVYDCVNRLVIRMNDADSTGEWVWCSSYLASGECRWIRLLFRTIELLWNLLEHGDAQQISDQLNSRVTIRLVSLHICMVIHLSPVFCKRHSSDKWPRVIAQYHRQLR